MKHLIIMYVIYIKIMDFTSTITLLSSFLGNDRLKQSVNVQMV
jgi:hypothetical protein